MSIRSLALGALCSLTLHGPAQAQTYSPEEAREDLQILYEGLQEAHYDLFQATPQSVFEREYDVLLRRLSRPIEVAELHYEFQRFAALARHAHARVEGLNPGFNAYLEAGGLLFPLDIAIRDGAVVVTGAPAGQDVRVGDEILRLEGAPNSDWISTLTANISAETPALAYSQLARMLPYYVWLEMGGRDTFSLIIRRDGQAHPVTVSAVDYETYASTPTLRSSVDRTGRAGFMATETIAYLRPGPFYNLQAERPEDAYAPDATRRFVTYIDAQFEAFIAADARALIVDLRDNPGGDASYSDPVIAWFADEAFRFYSEFRMKVSRQTTAANAARLVGRSPEDAGISGVFAELFEDHEPGDIVYLEIDPVEPRADRFAGPVYVMINAESYSNAATSAALIQDYGFGLVVGEATTDMATTFGATEHFILPNSGFRVGYPKAHIIRPNGEERLHPVTPDIALQSVDVSLGEDWMLQAVVALIEDAL